MDVNRRDLIEQALVEETILTDLEQHVGVDTPVTRSQRKVLMSKLRAAIELSK